MLQSVSLLVLVLRTMWLIKWRLPIRYRIILKLCWMMRAVATDQCAHYDIVHCDIVSLTFWHCEVDIVTLWDWHCDTVSMTLWHCEIDIVTLCQWHCDIVRLTLWHCEIDIVTLWHCDIVTFTCDIVTLWHWHCQLWHLSTSWYCPSSVNITWVEQASSCCEWPVLASSEQELILRKGLSPLLDHSSCTFFHNTIQTSQIEKFLNQLLTLWSLHAAPASQEFSTVTAPRCRAISVK